MPGGINYFIRASYNLQLLDILLQKVSRRGGGWWPWCLGSQWLWLFQSWHCLFAQMLALHAPTVFPTNKERKIVYVSQLLQMTAQLHIRINKYTWYLSLKSPTYWFNSNPHPHQAIVFFQRQNFAQPSEHTLEVHSTLNLLPKESKSLLCSAGVWGHQDNESGMKFGRLKDPAQPRDADDPRTSTCRDVTSLQRREKNS